METSRFLAALFVGGLWAATQPGSGVRTKPQSRLFLDIGCRGQFKASYMGRLEKICESCYWLYRKPQVYSLCRHECYKNEHFDLCVEALLQTDQLPELKRMINYLYS